jgi:hypothetical protein
VAFHIQQFVPGSLETQEILYKFHPISYEILCTSSLGPHILVAYGLIQKTFPFSRLIVLFCNDLQPHNR